jgi:N-acetylneuraminic acid mutarotase
MLIYRDNRLSRYRPAEDRWETLARAPYSVNSGADMVYLKGNIYVGFGGYQKKFARYSIATNSWAVMADFKELVFSGHSLATDGTDIYALRGGNTMDFWKYEVANNRWVILSNAPATMYLGADLIYVKHQGTNYLYTPRGNSTTFYRYNIDTLSWETMAPLLTSVADNGNITKRGDYIYMLRGGAQTNFYRYSIVDNQWTSLTSTPTATRYVGVTYNAYEDLIYVFQGNNTYNWWKFDPDLGATGTYLGEVDLPATPGSGADLIFKNDTLYFRRGRNTGTYYTYNITTDIWTTRDPAPSSATFNDDNKGILAGDYIYYYQGSGTSNFYRYNTLTNTWETRQTTLNPINYGASLAYTGSGIYLYGTRGGINNNFYRYNISSNSWLAMASLPTDSETGYGSRLVSDGTYIYAITGGGLGRLL